MTFVYALIVLTIAGLIGGGVVLLLSKKTLPRTPLRIRKARPPEMVQQEEAALMELAQRAVSRSPELGSTPAALLSEIKAYCDKTRTGSDITSRIILEKMLTAGSLKQARSYWQVHGFLDYRDNFKKTR